MPSTPALLADLTALARQAGDAILAVYESDDFHIESKQDSSPLTAADLAAHRVLVEGLRRLTPQIPVLSEESSDIPWATRQGWSRHWLVDPLDGTKEFIKRNGEFTVNIALIEGGEPTLGVVYQPTTGITWTGARGLGAARAQGQGAAHPIQARAAASPLVVSVSRSHPEPALEALLAQIGPHERRALGSSLKLCLIAEGAVDLYPRLGPTSEWDTAAAQAVLEAAGGVMLQPDGQPMRYNQQESLLNPHFYAMGDPSIWAAVRAAAP
jgi:3'(2'), 5'-bisphosphate nucleotidase